LFTAQFRGSFQFFFYIDKLKMLLFCITIASSDYLNTAKTRVSMLLRGGAPSFAIGLSNDVCGQ
jgi:hypothetical protein